MSQEKKKSKYQAKMRVRYSMANKIGGKAFYTNSKGKRVPHALPMLQGMKVQKETETQELADTLAVEAGEDVTEELTEYDNLPAENPPKFDNEEAQEYKDII